MIQEKIKQIHTEFKNALDSSSLKTAELSDDFKQIKSAANRLSELGLKNSKTYKNLETKLNEINNSATTNDLIKQIKRLETTFPNYRLIGLKKLLEICNKYKLCVSNIRHYEGVIPNKNLTEIENHKNSVSQNALYNPGICASFRFGKDSIDELIKGNYRQGKDPYYFIAAPEKDFVSSLTNIGGILYDLERPSFKLKTKIITPDPIVLCPVYIEGHVIFQIITAWGVEADDDYISNQVKIDINNN